MTRYSAAQALYKKAKNKKITIAVVGLGYVGLPLALAFAKKGLRVLGIDTDCDRLSKIHKGISYITDIPTAALRKIIARGTFRAEGSFRSIKEYDVIIICVPTPLKRKYHPNISYIIRAVREIKKYLRPGQLVILESTTYPGTTEEVIMPLLESKKLKCGRDFYLAFSPERIDPGNAGFPVEKIPKVVGGVTRESTRLASLVYKNIIEQVVEVSSARVAEAVKLLENTFRIVNIGLIDEIAMMAHKMHLDVWEVISAAGTKPFGFMPFYPGPGVGGHCIPKDPLYLYWKAKKFGFKSRFIKLASDIITSMPAYVVRRVEGILSKEKTPLRKAKILIIGVAYKKDVKDLRKSPALDVIDILQKKGARVSYYDPLIPYLRVNGINLVSLGHCEKNIRPFDCVIVATDHTTVRYNRILKNAKMIFDTRNVYHGITAKNLFRL